MLRFTHLGVRFLRRSQVDPTWDEWPSWDQEFWGPPHLVLLSHPLAVGCPLLACPPGWPPWPPCPPPGLAGRPGGGRFGGAQSSLLDVTWPPPGADELASLQVAPEETTPVPAPLVLTPLLPTPLNLPPPPLANRSLQFLYCMQCCQIGRFFPDFGGIRRHSVTSRSPNKIDFRKLDWQLSILKRIYRGFLAVLPDLQVARLA